MKIIRLSTFLDFGGIETKMVNLSRLDDKNNEWIFVAINKGGVAEKKIRANRKKVFCLDLSYRIPSIKTIVKLYRFLKKEKPDVLHTSGAEANFFGYTAGRLAGIPNIIVEEIGIPSHSNKAKRIFRYIFSHANWVIGESKLVVDNILSNYKSDPHRTKVVHNFGVFNYNFLSISNQRLGDGLFRIITISRLESVKNIEGVIRVLSSLIKGNINIELTIAGSGILEESLKKLVADLNLTRHVKFVGFITDPYPYLESADLYILNSFTEGFSNSLIEAMYSKTLSLSTNVGAAPEIIVDSKNGFTVPVDDEKTLYEKIKNIIAMSKEQREVIELAGYQTVVRNFSLDNHISELMKIYNKK